MAIAANVWFNRRRLIAFLIIATLPTLVIFTISPEHQLMVRRQYEETTGAGAEDGIQRTSTESVPSYPSFGTSTTDENGAGSTINETKVILFWGERMQNEMPRWLDFVKSGSSSFEMCQWTNCQVSRDSSRVGEATIVVFRPSVPYPVWPNVRFPNQTYIHVLNERPFDGHWWLAKFDDKINLTWNYRQNADIPHHHITVKLVNRRGDKYEPRVPFANKTKMAVWAVSHCKTASKREDYVAELQKYIDVDIFGECGTFDCSRQYEENCTALWEREYKFYLAFENSVCQDYITEKFYRTLKLDLIPVVLGGGDYKKIAPPHSYIDIRDFQSPKQLADYLHQLANNEDQYYEYFQWRTTHSLRYTIRPMCKMCEIANNMRNWSKPAIHDYYQWWMKACENDLIDRMREEGGW